MQPLNILSVKIGTKYSSDLVNNLYIMCRKNITTPFTFFCYTDDITGLLPDINVINFVDHGLDMIYYNKLIMFSPWFDKQIPPNKRLYFDLDLIIKFNIDGVIVSAKGDLTLIDAVWRKKYPPGFPVWHHPFNSSCMIWEPSSRMNCIWEHLMKDPEKYMSMYHWGMDSFLFYEKESIGIDIKYFPERKFYSHLYGVDDNENALRGPAEVYRFSLWANDIEKIPIVLLNGPTTQGDYKSFKKYYLT